MQEISGAHPTPPQSSQALLIFLVNSYLLLNKLHPYFETSLLPTPMELAES